MKTSLMVSAVVGAHVAVGCAFLIQGCGTTRGPVSMPTETPMPPSVITESMEPEVVMPPPAEAVVVPEAKAWPVDATTTYVVGKGDTLSGIAHRYGISVAEVMTINRIADPNKIRLGQKLLLPGNVNLDKPVKTVKPASSRAAAKLPAGSNAYVVQAGDCLSVIAAKAGVTTMALKEANGLNNNKIYVGETLTIPGGKPISATQLTRPAFTPRAPVPVSSLPSVSLDAGADDLAMIDLAPELPVSSASATMYTVQAGDDILTVASELNVSIADLRSVNRLSSDRLVPGQKLVIPTQD